MNNLASEQRKQIDNLNALDIELYAFAKKLMFQRYIFSNSERLVIYKQTIYLYFSFSDSKN